MFLIRLIDRLTVTKLPQWTILLNVDAGRRHLVRQIHNVL